MINVSLKRSYCNTILAKAKESHRQIAMLEHSFGTPLHHFAVKEMVEGAMNT